MERRTLLAGLGAIAVSPAWAATGARHVAAAREPSGSFALFGLSAEGALAFRIPLPGRGHAAAAHPERAEAVAFARRPGRFGIVLDCTSGREIARLAAPEGRHFYGHGAFSGGRLWTTENAYDTGEGRLGIWDAATFERLGEVSSGGIGPHEVVALRGDLLAVANGGIRTHPARGRETLNLASMRPNLAYLRDGRIVETVELPGRRLASIRHLSARADGTVALAMQWQTDAPLQPLLALHRRGEDPRLLSAGAEEQPALGGYAGSVAFSGDGRQVAITSPRGGVAHVYDVDAAEPPRILRRPDICGASAWGAGLGFTDGMGGLLWPGGARRHRLAWDNHLVAV